MIDHGAIVGGRCTATVRAGRPRAPVGAHVRPEEQALSQQQPATIAIVGAGQAGGRLASALREAGYAGRVVLYGEEPLPPYERPPLSKEFLAGGRAAPIPCIAEDPHWNEQRIELRLGCRVAAIDVGAAAVVLADGGREHYDRLVLATGARPRRLQVPGGDLPGVFYLRTVADALALHECLVPGSRCVVVGGGLIGLEVAATAVQRGCEVQVLEAADRLLARVAPPPVSAFMQRRHAEHGVRIELGAAVVGIEGPDRARAVVLADGRRIAADAVVVGIGAIPEDALATAAGIACRDGILVDEFGRTSVAGVYAIGDACRFYNPRYATHQRLEAWNHAQLQPATVAAHVLGTERPYAPVPWCWTDQYGHNLQVFGSMDGVEHLVCRGAPEDARLSCFGLRGDRMVAAWLVDAARDRRPVQQLIESGAAVDAARLADARVPIAATVVPPAAAATAAADRRSP
jgi:NADPH-dependent 2,4-dienoyl-CoA reductase/sulfur reductase-like enzyme